ncbi:MAG TPA: amidohydrolase family protein [Thermomicrobiales bacterium]|nr:amidohydrolase family protein [Thermomicrobiales bacterium]
MTVIDVHTHILSREFVDLLAARGGPEYEVKVDRSQSPAVHRHGAPFMTLQSGMFDVAERLAAMDAGGVDVGVLSLTCPNVYWGTREDSLHAARAINDYIAEVCRAHPGRFLGLASLPWQYPDDAVAELDRACDELGHVGAIVLANVAGESLTDPRFAPIWAALDRRGLPVLLHPTTPPGVEHLDMTRYNLVAAVGFMVDTTIAVARMIYDGFLDRYPNLKLIAPHAGGTLPYVVGRLDRCYEQMPACRAAIAEPPSSYLRRIYYDSVCYDQGALDLCLRVGGTGQLLFGSDYPHNIGDITGCLARVRELPAGVVEEVQHRNAERLFNV